eukprot:12857045-Ditylum_brightwellii.AAC.1
MLENVHPLEVAKLPVDVDGPGPQECWSYSSVVGMLLYCACITCPDIAMAVHQCARYSHNPWICHKKAVKRTVHYLIGTKDTGPGKTGFWGMVIDPTGDLTLDCYCDANFTGLWGREDDQDPISVKSRTGIVLTLGQTPIVLVLKMQTEIACSTTEAEYTVLSHSMRGLLTVR